MKELMKDKKVMALVAAIVAGAIYAMTGFDVKTSLCGEPKVEAKVEAKVESVEVKK